MSLHRHKQALLDLSLMLRADPELEITDPAASILCSWENSFVTLCDCADWVMEKIGRDSYTICPCMVFIYRSRGQPGLPFKATSAAYCDERGGSSAVGFMLMGLGVNKQDLRELSYDCPFEQLYEKYKFFPDSLERRSVDEIVGMTQEYYEGGRMGMALQLISMILKDHEEELGLHVSESAYLSLRLSISQWLDTTDLVKIFLIPGGKDNADA